jgi:hypothetical protein
MKVLSNIFVLSSYENVQVQLSLDFNHKKYFLSKIIKGSMQILAQREQYSKVKSVSMMLNIMLVKQCRNLFIH